LAALVLARLIFCAKPFPKEKEELAGMRTAFLQGAYHKGIKEKVAVQIF